jgi:hypothetical protein
MSDFTEGDPMIEELAYAAEMTNGSQDEHLEHPATFFRGALFAVALSLPVWSGLIWGLTKIG